MQQRKKAFSMIFVLTSRKKERKKERKNERKKERKKERLTTHIDEEERK